jgi:hypothetical protein
MVGRLGGLGDKFLYLNLTVDDVDEMIARLEHALAQQMGVPREVKSIQGTPPNQETGQPDSARH